MLCYPKLLDDNLKTKLFIFLMKDILVISLFYLPVIATYYNFYWGLAVSTLFLCVHLLELFPSNYLNNKPPTI